MYRPSASYVGIRAAFLQAKSAGAETIVPVWVFLLLLLSLNVAKDLNL